MSKNFNRPTTLLDQTVSGTVYSSVYGVPLEDNAAIYVSWENGSSPDGEVIVQAGILYNLYEDLELSATPSISGTTGAHLITINELPFSHLRVKLTMDSGSADVSVKAVSKRV